LRSSMTLPDWYEFVVCAIVDEDLEVLPTEIRNVFSVDC